MRKNNTVKFIDLFAGMGGLRMGFEDGFWNNGFRTQCVMTSEVKPYAVDVLKDNFGNEPVRGDITKIPCSDIPEFDFLLAGFPCQPFSSGGKGLGFSDTRGTLFYEIARILKGKQPYGFLLENVEGLVRHRKGRTMNVIIESLEGLGYKVSWIVLDSADFGLAQSRKRVFIAGTRTQMPRLMQPVSVPAKLSSILQGGLPTVKSNFTNLLLAKYPVKELYGKSIKDKRGGKNNIHSWDFSLKGKITPDQAELLGMIFKERRKKHWADIIGIDWMDGMPLTTDQIRTFYDVKNLDSMLDNLRVKGYLKLEHPKKLVKEMMDGVMKTHREYDTTKDKGYNIVAGQLSFEFNKILDPDGICNTIVATDVSKIGVPDGDGIRRLTKREGMRLFGFPEEYVFPSNIKDSDAFDLLGNTVAIPAAAHVAMELANIYIYQTKTYNYEV